MGFSNVDIIMDRIKTLGLNPDELTILMFKLKEYANSQKIKPTKPNTSIEQL